MNKGNLLVSSFLTILLTGFVLTHSDWLPTKTIAHAGAPRSEAHADGKSQEALASNSGRRWRNCQPNHWRGYMIQH